MIRGGTNLEVSQVSRSGVNGMSVDVRFLDGAKPSSERAVAHERLVYSSKKNKARVPPNISSQAEPGFASKPARPLE